MHAFSKADFLSLWERGRPLQPLDRGLLAIHTAFPETRAENVADWPLGRRNRALVELRCSVFGSSLQAWTACPQCGEKIELNLDTAAVIRESAPPESSMPEPVQTITVNGERFRLPTSRDLARLVGEDREEQEAPEAIRLLQACCLEKEKTEETDKIWSDQQIEEIGEKMAEADPLAEILLSFQCPACSTTSNGSLDLPTFLWTEIEAQVRRLVAEIHMLASAYGWTEREILSLSDARRRLYLEMVRA